MSWSPLAPPPDPSGAADVADAPGATVGAAASTEGSSSMIMTSLLWLSPAIPPASPPDGESTMMHSCESVGKSARRAEDWLDALAGAMSCEKRTSRNWCSQSGGMSWAVRMRRKRSKPDARWSVTSALAEATSGGASGYTCCQICSRASLRSPRTDARALVWNVATMSWQKSQSPRESSVSRGRRRAPALETFLPESSSASSLSTHRVHSRYLRNLRPRVM
mmetsp:Transcript_69149/g.164088  ORF Transcript_69149/g.164088 Transcript_69149/m.164088 type:complete len:221 (+) Transcript_69149:886-1548(+)